MVGARNDRAVHKRFARVDRRWNAVHLGTAYKTHEPDVLYSCRHCRGAFAHGQLQMRLKLEVRNAVEMENERQQTTVMAAR